MPAFRAVLGMVFVAMGLWGSAANGQEWDAAQCNDLLRAAIENIEKDRDNIEDLRKRLAEAQRMGKADEAARHATPR